MEVSKVIGLAYKEVREFNDIAGNLTGVTDDSVDNQISFIFEELTETITAFEAGDRVEVLDGACDLFVTVAGLLQKLEAQGYNVAYALGRVNANNLSKFPAALTAVDAANADYVVTKNEKYGRYVLKDKVTGKVKKPSDFSGVYLTDLLPKRGV